MKVKIRRIGNSFGIIIPKDILRILRLNDNNEAILFAKSRRIELVLASMPAKPQKTSKGNL